MYLKGTREMGITYRTATGLDLSVIVDSYFVGDHDDRKYRARYVFQLTEGCI